MRTVKRGRGDVKGCRIRRGVRGSFDDRLELFGRGSLLHFEVLELILSC